MTILIRPLHRALKKRGIHHHHLLLAWSVLALLFPLAATAAFLTLNFSSITQALSLWIMDISLGVFFFILLEEEEVRWQEEQDDAQKAGSSDREGPRCNDHF